MTIVRPTGGAGNNSGNFPTPEQYGAKGDGTTDDSTAFLAAINAVSGKPLYCANTYKVQLTLTDQSVHLTGPGTLIHQQAKSVIKVTRSLGAAITVSSISTVQIGSTGGNVTETMSTLTLATMSGITQGDLFLLSSEDVYPFSANLPTAAGIAAPADVWQVAYVPVLGVGITVTLTGTVAEGDTVTGATSGASGVVASTAPGATSGQQIVVFNTVTGVFSAGENARVGGVSQGTTVGAPYVVMSGRLVDTYTTNVKVRKVSTTARFVIDGLRVRADGDVDSIVGASNRQPAFLLKGIYKPQVRNFTIDSAWGRCWMLQSCYGAFIETTINKLPNNASTSEGAYGYGVEFGAATEQSTAIVRGGNCRHGFTTNVYWGALGVFQADPLPFGTPKYNTVRDSHIVNAIASSFDTHWGTYFQKFINCTSVHSTGASRTLAASSGFQNRGFGTLFDGCTDHGGRVSFIENSGDLEAGFPHVITWRDCSADNYQFCGLEVQKDYVKLAGVTNARLDIVDFTARADGSATSTPYYQSGVYIRQGDVTLTRVRNYRMNGTPIRVTGGGGRLHIVDCYSDYSDSPNTSTGLRFDLAPFECNVSNYRVRPHPVTANTPSNVFRVAGGDVTLNLDGYSVIGGHDIPVLAGITAGTLVLTWTGRSDRFTPITTLGDVSVTLTPRNSTPVQVWNTPLTTNRTVTLPTTAGAVINGDSFRVVRTAVATGASTLTVAGKALALGQWADVAYNGTAWAVVAAGSL